MNLILPKYFALYIIYKKLLDPPKKQNDPLGVRNPQVENHWPIAAINAQIFCQQLERLNQALKKPDSVN